jgi:hypothetical protein
MQSLTCQTNVLLTCVRCQLIVPGKMSAQGLVSHNAVNSGKVRQVTRGSSPAGKALDPRHPNRSCARAPLTITISLELGAAARGTHRAVSVDS